MSTDDRMETITDPALIRATDDPDERGDFPCCADRAHKESLGGDSESGTYNRSNRPPAGPCTDERTTPAPVSGAGLDLDASHVRTDPACTFHDGTTPPASRGKRCPACMRLDLDAIERRANGATPGWWQEVDDLDGGWQVLSGKGEEITGSGLPIADAEFIATLDPPTVLALVAEVRRLTESRSTVAANLAASLLRAEAEVRTLRAKVAEVDALPDEWEGEADANETHPKECRTLLSAASQLRAALATTGEGQ